jgi:hypothetical protein
MITVIDKLENKEVRTNYRLKHVDALFLGLHRQPHNYEYRGEIVDCGNDGKCVCGHKIRQGFVLHHKSDPNLGPKIVGCVCVEQFAAINLELYKSLMEGVAKLKEQIREAKARAKRSQAEAEVESLRTAYEAKHSAMVDLFEGFKLRGQRAPRPLWEAVASSYRIPRKAPEYSRPADYKRWYKERSAWIDSAIRNSGL